MRCSFVLLCNALLLVSAVNYEKPFYDVENAEFYFQEFIKTYKREYASVLEREQRFEIFKENLMKINERNKKSEKSVHAITRFVDMTSEELKHFNGYKSKMAKGPVDCTRFPYKNITVPESFDWRDQKKVTEVKNQEQCGSCWAFSTVGNIEGQVAIHKNRLQSLSVKQLIDCDSYDNSCRGGMMNVAFTWLMRSGGSMTEADYPYEPLQSQCKFEKDKAVVKLKACYDINVMDEDVLKSILVQNGPLSFAVDSAPYSTYHMGILHCQESMDIDHAVLLVGYGKEDGEPYWIVKNSWGEGWGESGYARVQMYKNSCNMLSAISTAVVE